MTEEMHRRVEAEQFRRCGEKFVKRAQDGNVSQVSILTRALDAATRGDGPAAAGFFSLLCFMAEGDSDEDLENKAQTAAFILGV